MKDDAFIENIKRTQGQSLTEDDMAFLSHIAKDEDFPLVDVPAGLSEKLYAITEKGNKPNRSGWSKRWYSAVAGLAAAGIAGVMMLSQFNQTPNEAEIRRAKHELALAFSYLNAANQKASVHVRHSVNESLQKAAVKPVFTAVVEETQEI